MQRRSTAHCLKWLEDYKTKENVNNAAKDKQDFPDETITPKTIVLWSSLYYKIHCHTMVALTQQCEHRTPRVSYFCRALSSLHGCNVFWEYGM